MIRRRNQVVFLLAVAGALAFVIWITLLSRIGSDVRAVYSPLWSYRAVLNGNGRALLENAENVLLFIPVGLLAAAVLHLNLWQAALLGLAVSLAVECSQWLFWLGSFEFDDLLHNTAGALIGAAIVEKTEVGQALRRASQKKDSLLIAILVAAFLAVPLGGQWAHERAMKRFAALSDRETGAVNLLVLNGQEGQVGETGVRVSYLDDGSVCIDGVAEKRAWMLLGKLTLPKGVYRFSGFPEAPENGFDLELECLNKETRRFTRIAALDSEREIVFSLESESRLRVLAGVFPGAEGTVLARPAIYLEE